MEYKEFAINLAREAGEIMKNNFSLGMKKEWKEDRSPVTATDIAINKMVIEVVKKYFPDHEVMGEEESYRHNGSEYVWVCDPVDGTIPFSHGMPLFTFVLALVKDGEPIVGVIYDPMLDRLFYAEKGKGTYLNGKKIIVSPKTSLSQSYIEIAVWSSAPFFMSNIAEEIEKTGAEILHIASINYSSMLLACGEMMGTVFCGDTAHDIAATKIIVEEAGGKVTDLFGKEQRYDRPIRGAVCSNGIVHDKLVEITSLLGKMHK